MPRLVEVQFSAFANLLPADLGHAAAYTQLRALLAERGGPETAQLFAEPRSANGCIEFLIAEGWIARFDELDAESRALLRAEIGRLVSILRRGAAEKAREDPRRFGHLPRLVASSIEIPSFEYVFAHEGRPVLAAWGLVPAGAPAGLGLVSALDDGKPVERQTSFPAAASGLAALSALVVGGLAFLAAPVVAAWFDPPLPVCKVVPAERDALIGLDDERRRERDLRQRVAAVQRELGEKRASCPLRQLPPPPPAATTPPQPGPTSPPSERPPAIAAPPPPMQPPRDTTPCNVKNQSGGAGTTQRRHFLGNRPGRVRLEYDMSTQPDQIKVIYRGQTLAQSRGYVAHKGTIEFDWSPPPDGPPGNYVVVVEVKGNPGSTTTVWNYTLGCP